MTDGSTPPPALSVLAVHGVGNSFGRGVLGERLEERRRLQAAAWARHLAGGLGIAPERLDLDFAYYADKLATHAGPPPQGEDDGGPLTDPLAQELMEEWAATLGMNRLPAQGHLTLPVRQLAAWLARRFDLDEGRLRVFVRLLFTEVTTYLRAVDAEERIAARAEVAARIARHRPRVVVAHSLGSVVAYEALHLAPDAGVELFLTLGSPLALPKVVFDRLDPAPAGAPAPTRGVRPPGAARWVNIADPGDPVAVPPGLAAAFDGLDLDLTDTVHPLFGFHHAKNYLGCAGTAATLAPFLTGS
ncbi:GPI inositol-deacylase [Streptomyces longispororuber]|uniref:GPI inositol-deacylase n=1 Tax=Streptomyces longispororuber TaxID=68230 RepID=UPI00210D82B4|nr:GPI inositol-deacylase [Streptomyces longispororuber]MCQ4211665.1 GPI inositol-deacylase [Streptomyces longispororuber]